MTFLVSRDRVAKAMDILAVRGRRSRRAQGRSGLRPCGNAGNAACEPCNTGWQAKACVLYQDFLTLWNSTAQPFGPRFLQCCLRHPMAKDQKDAEKRIRSLCLELVVLTRSTHLSTRENYNSTFFNTRRIRAASAMASRSS
jgi:hypothetical protein